jgi:hypothetical protein
MKYKVSLLNQNTLNNYLDVEKDPYETINLANDP